MKQGRAMTTGSTSKPARIGLLQEVRHLILSARETVSQSVNSALVLLYWKIGQRVRTEVLRENRAGYGERIIHALSGKLTAEFGRGFTKTNLFNMVRFAETYPDVSMVHALGGTLSWTHLREIIYLDDLLKRDVYAEMCRIERRRPRS